MGDQNLTSGCQSVELLHCNRVSLTDLVNSRVCQCVAVSYSIRGTGLVLLFLTAKHSFVVIQLCFCIHLLHAEK